MSSDIPMSSASATVTTMNSSSRIRRKSSENINTEDAQTLALPFSFAPYRRSPLSAEAYNSTALIRENGFISSPIHQSTSSDALKITPNSVASTSAQAIKAPELEAKKTAPLRPIAGRTEPLRTTQAVQTPPQSSFHFTHLREVYPFSTRADFTDDEVLIAEALFSPHDPSLIQMEVLDGDYTRGYDAYMKSTLQLDIQQSRGQKRKERE